VLVARVSCFNWEFLNSTLRTESSMCQVAFASDRRETVDGTRFAGLPKWSTMSNHWYPSLDDVKSVNPGLKNNRRVCFLCHRHDTVSLHANTRAECMRDAEGWCDCSGKVWHSYGLTLTLISPMNRAVVSGWFCGFNPPPEILTKKFDQS